MGDLTIQVTITGGDALLNVDAAALVRQIGRQAAEQMARATLTATLPHVPVDTGALQGSGEVTPTASGAVVDFPLDYAAEVHGPLDGSGAGQRTPPRDVPTAELQGWADRHGIPAWLVQRAIATNGTPYRPYLHEGLVEAEGQFPQMAADAAEALRAALTGGH